MATATRKTAPKQRTMQFYPNARLLFLAEGKKSSGYLLTETSDTLNADTHVRSYRLEKADGTKYDVLIDGAGSLCDCIGFEHRGMNTKDGKGCKHVAAIGRLLQLGKL